MHGLTGPRNGSFKQPATRPLIGYRGRFILEEDQDRSDRRFTESGLHRILPGINAGAVNGILTVMLQISFAAMIFSGPLSHLFPRGIGLTLFGGLVFGVAVALTSSVRGAVAVVQDAPCAILALAAAAVASGLPASAGESEVYFTIVAVISVSSILTGLAFYLLGRFHLGNLVRFIPYPVVGGFLAGIGWLIMKGGLGVMTGLTIDHSAILDLLTRDMILKWSPGLLLAAILLFLTKRFSHFLIMPATLIGSVAVFYLALAAAGIPIADAVSRGWFLGPFPDGALWNPLSPSLLGSLDWGLVFSQIGPMGTITVLSVISLLLNYSGLELIMRRDIDLNRELKVSGMANALAGLGGSPAGYPTLSLSALGYKLGSDSRIIGVTSGALCGLALFVGAGYMAWLPRCLAGGLLVFVGADLLLDRLHLGWKRLPRSDYAMVLLILLVIAAVGFLEGVAVGIVTAAAIFIIRYSRIDVVRLTLSGRSFRSHVERAAPLRCILREKGDSVQVLALSGFLFFGTANRLFEKVKSRACHSEMPELRFMVFDFTHVTGLDSSAINSFVRAEQLASTRGFFLVLVNLSPKTESLFVRYGLVRPADPCIKVFQDLDRAIEWCEEEILESETKKIKPESGEFLESTYEETMAVLVQQEALESLMYRLKEYSRVVILEKDAILIRQGDPPVGLFFIQTGEVTAWLEKEDGARVRLRTCGMGSIAGELSLYTDSAATATVVVTRPGVAVHLGMEALDRLEKESPELAAGLHRAMARLISERLIDATSSMKSVI